MKPTIDSVTLIVHGKLGRAVDLEKIAMLPEASYDPDLGDSRATIKIKVPKCTFGITKNNSYTLTGISQQEEIPFALQALAHLLDVAEKMNVQ
jgi:TATA-box binding protein (TBP) (component of TFIID and TFIIIB)